ncbi:MAG: glycosyltransferase family 39 protein [Bacteroidales bacterium]|nr:glycosyltransferase family 39 protein [Bacteroidales bacterium]
MNLNSRDYISKTFLFFLIAWGILNFLQAFLTPLNNDEAYYWMYSKYLDWGYFDHPPMIALMIRTGYLFFHNELGVRLLVVLSQLAALLIIWLLTDNEQRKKKGNILLFVMLVAILPVFNIYGFIATPDAPLLLFSAVFLLAYKRILKDENWQNTLFLGFSMAALMYSKYHGGLLIILVILSNLRLLKSPKFYMASIVAVILFLPHVFWQYSNDFPSLKYHFVERVSGFDPGNVPEYLLNQMFIHNPLILPICIWLIIKTRSKNKFEKALNYIVVGFLTFFFIASFSYHIEPQWTALISVSMIIILFKNLDYKSRIGGFIKWITIFLFPILLFARIAFMVDFLPVSYLKNEYHKTKKWANEISNLAGNRPVIFTNSYQNPSEYTFYTGKFAHSLNNLSYRKTQYDLWYFEEKVHGKEVLYVPHYLTDYYKENLTKHILPDGDSVFVRVFKDFQSLQRECVILSDDQYTFKKSEINTIHLLLFNPYPFQINLIHKELPVIFQIAFVKNGYMEVKKNLKLPDNILTLNVGDTISVDCQFTLEDLPPGVYKLAICSETGILYDTYNSKFKDVKINE